MPQLPPTGGRPARPPVERWGEVGGATSFSDRDPARLAATYWRVARRAMFGLVRPVGPPLGPVALRALGSRGPTLIRMGPAVVAADEHRLHVAFPILDGLVVGAPGGRLVLAGEQTSNRARVGVRVEGYTPRLHGVRGAGRLVGIPYAAAQAAVHDRVTAAYLEAVRVEGP